MAKISSADALRIAGQFRELAGRFRRIVARSPADVATEMNAAEENGARIINEAVLLGIKVDDEGFDDLLTKARVGAIPWKLIWFALINFAARRAPEYFGQNPYSIRWQPSFVQSENHGPVRMGETDGKNWAVRAENFAVIANQLSALCDKIANRLDVSNVTLGSVSRQTVGGEVTPDLCADGERRNAIQTVEQQLVYAVSAAHLCAATVTSDEAARVALRWYVGTQGFDYATALKVPAEAAVKALIASVCATSRERKLTIRKIADPSPEKTSWTQIDLHEAIRAYKAKRASIYPDLVAGVARGDRGAKQDAQRLFGRNAIARELGVKSKAMVSKSPEWQAIANDLNLSRPSPIRGNKKPQRIGLEIAQEQQAMTANVPVVNEAIRRETIRLIESSMTTVAAEATVERLERGDMSDDQARLLVETCADQKRDDHTFRIRQKP